MPRIRVENLTKSFPAPGRNAGRVVAIDGLSLDIKEGEFVTFFGPNGCGKSTLIKVLAGIEPYDSGSAMIDGRTPAEARTGVIFQDYGGSLMPWLTCKDNILFPFTLRRRRAQRAEAEGRLAELLSSLGLQLPLGNYPYEVSGGQQQLVAILRTLLYEPEVILMDEPFSALDFQTRGMLQNALLDIWHKTGTTILFVSHDIEEAIYLAGRLMLLTPLPARVKQEREIPFPRPRDPTLLDSDSFFHFKRDCLQMVRSG